MIVKYISQRKEFTDRTITLGELYYVIELLITNKDISLRVIDDRNCPVVFPYELFEITNSYIPDNWKIEILNDMSGNRYTSMQPVSFKSKISSFFEDYFDSTPELEKECKEIVEIELEKIKEFHQIKNQESKGSGTFDS